MPVLTDTREGVMTIVIEGQNALNPMSQDVYVELHRSLATLDRDPTLRCAILRGAGDQHFSAGGNLKRYGSASAALTAADHVREFWYPDPDRPVGAGVSRVTLYSRPTVKPVIAAIQGYCLGGALMIVGTHATIRIASESAQFGLAEIRRGLGGSASVRSSLPRQIAYTHLMWLLATAAFVDAHTARRMGIVTEVVSADRVFERAAEIASLIRATRATSVLAAKMALLHTRGMPQHQIAAVGAALGALEELGVEGPAGEADRA